MIKKADKLILKAFLGPFIITTAVVIFIFLIRFLLQHFQEFLGKDLGYEIFGKLFGYFTLITIPVAMPLAILLSSLISFGNLGEFSELTALKSTGVRTSRILLPTFIFAIFVAGFTFWFNTTISPWANLKGYSMLYDIKTTKVTMNIEEGIFYRGIPGYAIKVKKKFGDGSKMKGVMIYDHRQGTGNQEVTIADSARMYTINNQSYLVFELFKGVNYRFTNNTANSNGSSQQFFKNGFAHNKIVMSLESFGLKKTDENSFKYHHFMKNLQELEQNIDSLGKESVKTQQYYTQSSSNLYSYHFKSMVDTMKLKSKAGPWIEKRRKALLSGNMRRDLISNAAQEANSVKSHYETNREVVLSKKKLEFENRVEFQHKYGQTISILILFLIGASLGIVIRKGGFGLPVLIAVLIFILMYVLNVFFDKQGKEGIMIVEVATWVPNLLLSILATFALIMATKDKKLGNIAINLKILDKIKNFSFK